MLIDIYCPFYNEKRIVQHVVNYWKLLPIRKITLLNNNTTDNSLDCIKDNFKNVKVIENDEPFINDLKYLSFKNNEWKNSIGKVDFVLVCDFDEIIWSNNIIKSLENIKENNGSIINMSSFFLICNDDDFQNLNICKPLHLQNGIRFSYFNNKGNHKKVLFDPNKIKEINYSIGAHNCSPIGNINFYNSDILFMHATHLGLEFTLKKWKNNRKKIK